MPFVIRKVEPRYVSRGHVPQGSAAQGLPVGAELDAVANGALTTSLKQLASLIANAEEIFAELTAEVTSLADRSGLLRHRIDRVQNKLATIDPKKIPVRKYTIYSSNVRIDTGLTDTWSPPGRQKKALTNDRKHFLRTDSSATALLCSI